MLNVVYRHGTDWLKEFLGLWLRQRRRAREGESLSRMSLGMVPPSRGSFPDGNGE